MTLISSLFMRNNRPTVFLSCSEKFKKEVAVPIKLLLADRGIDAIIASEEPIPNNADWDPETKIGKLLEQSDCAVVLATPDDANQNGTFTVRNNVSDEVGRMRTMPHLRTRTLVFKEPTVTLPSNINPTFETLDMTDVGSVVIQIERQMTEWTILGGRTEAPVRVAATEEPPEITELLNGLEFADFEGTETRAFKMALELSRVEFKGATTSLVEFVLASSTDEDDFFIATALLESLSRLDQSIISGIDLERLALNSDHAVRSCAANLLWDLALTKPGDVPLGLLGRLIDPTNEDWYVYSPAMAAAKELMLVRPQTRSIFARLLRSESAEDRRAVAVALIDVARIDAAVVPPYFASVLATDSDKDIAAQGSVLQMIIQGAGRKNFQIGNFGL
jgi:hypothetical protein